MFYQIRDRHHASGIPLAEKYDVGFGPKNIFNIGDGHLMSFFAPIFRHDRIAAIFRSRV